VSRVRGPRPGAGKTSRAPNALSRVQRYGSGHANSARAAPQTQGAAAGLVRARWPGEVTPAAECLKRDPCAFRGAGSASKFHARVLAGISSADRDDDFPVRKIRVPRGSPNGAFASPPYAVRSGEPLRKYEATNANLRNLAAMSRIPCMRGARRDECPRYNSPAQLGSHRFALFSYSLCLLHAGSSTRLVSKGMLS
jgi:hypothetical protein